ncbi:ribosome biogenesis GTP-binding protein YihA/YsxC [Mycoplasmoides genitalium]|uniref:ribosome biogenesis GTP-binding protein YihA/YsxC n=1 Tax=Mycoplasmoides genitalium TaxID=2097 RepID=UPI00027B3D34|nr:ribosome biogenesis GTP-binding protein YihA/YsxC [Mycoplasmoides genitalium]AFQ03658.1 GTP-binding protein YsxC [Mycoplasmoides genitalium M6282]AFQ04666.1 GTP-binding protein YsxC [Mycoplasmoides genitalium M2288]
MDAHFLKSASDLKDCPQDNIPEICFMGRSNVGKSSLINAFFKKKLAKTSATPGRTQLLNYFEYKDKRFVDLPGYGFAKISKNKKDFITNLLTQFLNFRSNLVGVVLIVDSGVVTVQDQEVVKIILQTGLNFLIVANKFDKLNQSERYFSLKNIANFLKVNFDKCVFASTKTHHNLALVHKKIFELFVEDER